jgi:hypothetical protein
VLAAAGLVSSATSTPATATAAATAKAAFIPLVKTPWLTCTIAVASGAGTPDDTGATPTDTRLLISLS